jgi:hypothetical protein
MLKFNRNSGQKYSRAALLLIAGVAIAMTATSYAQETTDNTTNTVESVPAPSPSTQPSADKETENNRIKTLEGSKSRWSGQFNLNYAGSSINHPFAAEAINPGGQVPPPTVNLNGTFSARYRLNADTTVGLGTGLITYTPFQGPTNTSVSDPYADIAHSFKIGPIHNRGDFQTTLFTDHANRTEYGYFTQFTLLDEAYYTFPFGLTAGMLFEFDYALFHTGDNYPVSAQTLWDIITDPYFEYSLSKNVNLRTVVGMQSLHNNNLPGGWAMYHPKIYQTLGVGVAATDWFFIYTFLEEQDFTNMWTTRTCSFGFSATINLF